MPNLFKGHSGCKIELDSKGRVHKTAPHITMIDCSDKLLNRWSSNP